MNIVVNSQSLAAELRLLSKIVPSKPVIQILSHALLRAVDGRLSLFATDLEVGLSTTCEAAVQAPGAVALPCAKFLALVEQFTDGEVSIVAEKQGVVVRCGAFKSRLQAMPTDDFPREPAVDGTVSQLDAPTLRNLIAKTRCSVSGTAAKFVLQGALLKLTGRVAAMVSTDGKRLSLALGERQGPDQRVVVPMKMLDALAAGSEDGDLEFALGAKQMFFTSNGRVLSSRTMDGEFPAYERIIPKENDKVVAVERAALAAALRRLVLVAEENRAIYVNVMPGAMELSTASAEVGSADEAIKAEYDGVPLKICVNGEYVLDFLESSTAASITMRLKDESSAMRLEEGNDHLAVVMLMRGR